MGELNLTYEQRRWIKQQISELARAAHPPNQVGRPVGGRARREYRRCEVTLSWGPNTGSLCGRKIHNPDASTCGVHARALATADRE